MNKLVWILTAIVGLTFAGCTEEDENYMTWAVDNRSPENISWSSSIDNGIVFFTIDVNGNGGDFLMTCENAKYIDPGIGNLEVYDNGWGEFSVSGSMLICRFPEDNSGREPQSDQITVSATVDGVVRNTVVYVKRTFGQPGDEPETGEVSDNYKFKLVKGALMPFMNDDFGVAAPFDNLAYRITDYYERHQPFGFPEFTQHYDSIVWCADGFPDTVRVYERQDTGNSTEEHFSSQWSTHFFRGGEVKSLLKGYRDGKVVYSTSLTTYLYERDFLCYDWTDGSFAIANPGAHGISCLLDKKYEYSAADTQEMDGTRYARIGVAVKGNLSEEELLAYREEALTKLMADNIGQGDSPAGKTDAFRCLPSEGIEAVKFWENATTRILLIHEFPVEGLRREKYYLHIESK